MAIEIIFQILYASSAKLDLSAVFTLLYKCIPYVVWAVMLWASLD